MQLQCNIDGLPLTKSSSACFWPILGRVKNSIDDRPFPIAVYYGHGKPSNLSKFLSHFLTSVSDLISNGLMVDQKYYKVELLSLICDTPARNYLKCTVGHTHNYFSVLTL